MGNLVFDKFMDISTYEVIFYLLELSDVDIEVYGCIKWNYIVVFTMFGMTRLSGQFDPIQGYAVSQFWGCTTVLKI